MIDYQVFVDARKSDYIATVDALVKEYGIATKSINAVSAEAFLIGLTLDVFGKSVSSDIVLASFGLLRGYDYLDAVTLRRMKFLSASNHQGANTNSHVNYLELPTEELKEASKKYQKTENSLYQKLCDYFDKIEDKDAYFQNTIDRHLRKSVNGGKQYSMELPTPYYLSIVNIPSEINLPRSSIASIPRDNLLKAIQDGFKVSPIALETPTQILYGVTGVGKTYLACHYARSHRQEYDFVCFINAESESSIQKCCHDFLAAINNSFSDKSPEDQKRVFLNFFNCHDHWLLIFDNVDYLDSCMDENGEQSTMRDILETWLPNHWRDSGHILITTRCDNDFLDAKRIKVDVFSPETAVAYLNQATGISGEDDDALALAEELGYLPLALRYAGAFISESRNLSYAGYLKLYQEETEEVLEEELDSVSEKPVAVAFRMVRDKYQITTGNKKKDQLQKAALQFMDICAFIAPDEISLIPYAEDTTNLPEPLRSVLKSDYLRKRLVYHLTKYSLMDYDPATETFSIHRLLQAVIRMQEEKNKSDLVAYSYHALIKQYNLYKLGGTPERANLVRGLAPHMQAVMPCIVKAGINQSENLRVAEDYCTHNEKLRIKTSYNDLGEFLDNVEEECKIYEEELEYLKSVGLGKSHLAAIRLLLLGERLQILHNDETWMDPYFEAFDLSEELIDGFQPGDKFGKDDIWFLQALFVFTSCVRYCVDYLEPANIMDYYRHIIRSIDKLSTVRYVDDAQEYYSSLSSIFHTSLEMLAELSGRAVYGIARIPYYYLPDGSPDASYSDGCRIIVTPVGSPWVHNFPYTVIDGRKLRTYGYSMRGEYSRAANVNPDLANHFDFIAANNAEAIEKIIEIESDITITDNSGFVMALPDGCSSIDGQNEFHRELYLEICKRNGYEYNETAFRSYLDNSKQSANYHRESFQHYLEPSPEMRKIELRRMREMLDKIVNTMEIHILPISYDQFEVTIEDDLQ